MKKLKSDTKKGIMKLQADSIEDLWYLSQVIDQGDLVRARTFRKVKSGGEDERSAKAARVPMYLELKAERIDFAKMESSLRISGKITKGPEEVSLGSYHTFNVEPHSPIEIEKEKWFGFQLDMIEEASSGRAARVLMVAMDREEAFFARLKKYGWEFVSSLKGDVEKKKFSEKSKPDFYREIAKAIKELDNRDSYETIIIASPSFWKENLVARVSDESLKKKFVMATCSSVGRASFDEILRRDEVRSALRKDRIAREVHNVEELLSRISKGGNAVYGESETIMAGNAGAVDTLLLTDEFISSKRVCGEYEGIDMLMKKVDSMKGGIIIVSHEHEGGRKLKGLGGIGALTRYRIN